MDEDGKIYNSILTFREDVLIEKKMACLFERRTICEENEYNRYELLTEECLNTKIYIQTGVHWKKTFLKRDRD